MQAILDCLRDQLVFLSDASPAFCVAYSGGLDSQVLLHAMAQLRKQFPHLILRAIHVHHGLNLQADNWVNHCRNVCAEFKIDFHCEYLLDSPAPGLSVEAWARDSRYAVFASHLTHHECLLTAHTQDDQAETVLLQLLRGAGPKGLAAMPQRQSLGSGFLHRPLLNFSRSRLQQYADEFGLSWVEDNSNDDLRFDRNFLRHSILPALRERWPSASQNLARSAQHCAAAADILSAVARQDLGEQACAKTLPLAVLNRLPLDRQRNALREWLHQLGCRLPNTGQLERIERDLLQGRVDAQPQVSWGCWTLRRYRQELMVIANDAGKPSENLPPATPWDLSTALKLPGALGVLTATQERCGGLSLSIDTSRLSVGFRQGGERCRLAGKTHSVALKKLFQEWRIPPWRRGQIPLLFEGDELVAVIGYGVCANYAASPQDIGWQISHSLPV